MSKTQSNGPPEGHDWGERTKQAYGDVERAPGYWKTDAYEISRKFGISTLEYDPEEQYQVYPDVLIHETQPELTDSARATNALFEGMKGSGKTTNALDWAYQVMRLNDERVLWRGDPRRSGWLPYRHWTTLWLPESVEYEASWMLEGDKGDADDRVLEPVDDIDDVVREVRRYEDVRDLCDQLASTEPGTFNVIYPDPAFEGCEELSVESEAFEYRVPFVPKWETDEDASPTPTTHWWFAFLVARIDYGPFVYHSLFFDELNDLLPENASNHGDNAQTATKIRALQSVIGESRRRFLSIFGFCQEEVDLAAGARRRFDWRVAMPGRPNPCQTNNDSRVGFREIPMEYDTMKKRDAGTGLVYNEAYFNWYTWSDVTDPELETADGGKWLKLAPKTPDATAFDPASAVEFDDQLFSLEERRGTTYLVMNDPGTGYLTVESGVVGEEFTAPMADVDVEVAHAGTEDGGGWEVLLVGDEQRKPVASLSAPSEDHDLVGQEVGR